MAKPIHNIEGNEQKKGIELSKMVGQGMTEEGFAL